MLGDGQVPLQCLGRYTSTSHKEESIDRQCFLGTGYQLASDFGVGRIEESQIKFFQVCPLDCTSAGRCYDQGND